MIGSIKVYVCAANHRTVTLDREGSMTPFFIICRSGSCTLRATSCWYTGATAEGLTPEWEWYRHAASWPRQLRRVARVLSSVSSRDDVSLAADGSAQDWRGDDAQQEGQPS